MLKKIKIVNFQSHKNTEIDLARVTVLYGLSDSGKSAVRKALQCVVNKSPFYLRTADGVSEGSITLEFDDYKIERIVKLKSVRKCPNCKGEINGERICPNCAVPIPLSFSKDVYIVNDKDEYERFGIELPEHIQKELGFTVEKFDAKSVNYNVMSQFDDMFFIGKSYDSIRNRMINILVPDSESIVDAIRDFKDEKNKLVSDSRTYNSLVAEIDSKLESFDKASFEKLTAYAENFHKAELKIDSERRVADTLRNIRNVLMVAPLASVDLEKYIDYIYNLAVAYEKIRDMRNRKRVLSDLREKLLFNKIDLSSVNEIGEKLDDLQKNFSTIASLRKKALELREISQILSESDKVYKDIGERVAKAKEAYENAKKQYILEQNKVVCPITGKQCSVLTKA